MTEITKILEQFQINNGPDLSLVLEKFDQGLNVDGLIIFTKICFKSQKISDCLQLYAQVLELEIFYRENIKLSYIFQCQDKGVMKQGRGRCGMFKAFNPTYLYELRS